MKIREEKSRGHEEEARIKLIRSTSLSKAVRCFER